MIGGPAAMSTAEVQVTLGFGPLLFTQSKHGDLLMKWWLQWLGTAPELAPSSP